MKKDMRGISKSDGKFFRILGQQEKKFFEQLKWPKKSKT